ncbi:PD-(D/E)XK nuclease superfamily protein [Acinetobacter sp. BIGb0102]|uniref:PDDEXK-like family protein n=1 Tax=Acinetobacter sp. BIGb0102 TaxID=2485131 RepID=UPI000F5008CF|nr:PD-(D/E)XK nuclease family protein [Acinetobacter sp. BIGb0102]RPE27398.1 PD-(D/E)XK nuclease superfamily protein [Acinetobacter sp. BIGb0102]
MILNQFDFSNQLSNFFNDWKIIEQQQQDVVPEQLSFEQKLELFFNKFRDLPSIEEVPEQPLFVDSMALEIFFKNFDLAVEPLRAAKKQGLALNAWKVAGLKDEEVRHSKVLKWFLDCRGDHGRGNEILLQLLKELPVLEKYQPKRYFTTEECCPLGNQESRVDIEIDADEFLLFIEIKINATEGKDQLQRYIDIAQAKAKKRDWLVVYLTREGKLPEKYKFYQEQKRLIGLSWKKLAEIFYEHVNENDDVNSRSVWLVKQFADHIKNFN